MPRIAAFWIAVALQAFAASVAAEQSLRVGRLYTTVDGQLQLVELELVGGGSRPDPGTTWLATVDANGVRRDDVVRVDFPADRSRIIVAYDPHDAWQDWCWWSECAITAKSATPLIDIGGGTLVVPLHDSWRYPAPPLDGWSMLDRDLGVVPANLGSTSAIATPPVYPRPNLELATAYEYVHASGSYFLTTRADEIDALDSGRLPGWRRTGESFLLWARALDAGSRLPASAPGTAQVCRALFVGASGFSHHYSAYAGECNALAASLPTFETPAAFHAVLPDPDSGHCPVLHYRYESPTEVLGLHVELLPVYRLWDGRVDPPRHRFVGSAKERDAMIARGWIAEGDGSDGVAFCAWSRGLYPVQREESGTP